MRKIKITILALGALVFTACGNDDNSNGNDSNECQTCTLDVLGEQATAEYCDNGDGTITIIANGEETTESLDGATFDEFIAAFELFGAICD